MNMNLIKVGVRMFKWEAINWHQLVLLCMEAGMNEECAVKYADTVADQLRKKVAVLN